MWQFQLSHSLKLYKQSRCKLLFWLLNINDWLLMQINWLFFFYQRIRIMVISPTNAVLEVSFPLWTVDRFTKYEVLMKSSFYTCAVTVFFFIHFTWSNLKWRYKWAVWIIWSDRAECWRPSYLQVTHMLHIPCINKMSHTRDKCWHWAVCVLYDMNVMIPKASKLLTINISTFKISGVDKIGAVVQYKWGKWYSVIAQ
jgi:hypothetical protein